MQGKLGHPFTHWERSHYQDHASMNVWVLSNPLPKLQHNEQKEIVQAKTHATREWDHLQNDALIIKPTPKPTLVKVTFSKLLTLLAIPPPCNDQVREG